jgi:tRNA A-37 threonylcarbamoyl transferase component Bud32/tetratricopeptide (TPR) repeat protein
MSGPNTETVDPFDPIPFSRSTHLQRGDVVADRYEILRILGKGGSATVYAVCDRVLHGEIALKVLHPDKVTEINVERSRREAAIARSSSSSRLVRTYDLQQRDGLVLLPMELVEGGTLRDLIRRRGVLPMEEVIAIAQKILAALADLHALSIIHRDLKPANLLLAKDGEVKLSDFGLARKWTEEQARLTKTDFPVGTLDYIAPEQALNQPVDPRADLYSFGVVLFELLTGRLPFESPSALTAILLRLQERPPDVRALRRDTPEWLAAIVERLLETDPARRYPSAQAVLREFQSRSARRTRRWLRVVPAALLLLVIVAVMMLRTPEPPRLVADGDWGLRALDDDGRVLWSVSNSYPRTAAIVRRSRWSRPELATVLSPPAFVEPDVALVLSFLDPWSGRLLRTRRLPDASWQFLEFARRWSAAEVRATDLDRDGANEVLVTYLHTYWPAFTVIYDMKRDESRILFVATGHHRVATTVDLDHDGREEILFSGIANKMGWNIAIGALRVPREWPPPSAILAVTPDRELRRTSETLLWYALAPPGPVGGDDETTVDQERRRIRVRYPTGKEVALDFAGFADPSAAPPEQRQQARVAAYERLRAAQRASSSGSHESAMAAVLAARQAANAAGDARLVEWIERVHARFLTQAGRFDEADRSFRSLLERSDAKGDVAWDAAVAMHLAGELPRAVEWYRLGTRQRALDPFAGRLMYEYYQGLILALGEMGRWNEAVAEADAFAANDPDAAPLAVWFRRYITWRSGGVLDPVEVNTREIDIARYWSVEMALATGADPRKLLPQIEAEAKRSSGNRNLLLSARSEVLRRLGRNAEALALARQAYRDVLADRRTSTESRAHFDLVAERLAALAPTAEADGVRAEAAALRWRATGMSLSPDALSDRQLLR